MLEGLRAFPRILLEHWPALLAWYLAGGVVRLGIMYAAAPLSRDQPVLALLFLPLAVLARLIAYVAMFLTVRRSMPGYRALESPADEPAGTMAFLRRFLTTLFPAIAPFAVVYGLVGGIQEDFSTYAQITYRYSFGVDNGYGVGVGSGPVVIVIIVVAFVGRQLLGRFGHRLGSWTVLPETYLESTWTFVAVAGVGNLIGGLIGWLRDRQVVSLLIDTREGLVELGHGFAVALEGVDGLVPTIAQYLLQPMAWLLVAGIVYLQSLERVRRDRVVPRGFEIRARARLAVIPRPLARAIRGLAGDWDDVYKPVVLTFRMMRSQGLLVLLVVLAALGLLYAVSGWGTRLLVLAIGPHEIDFWAGAVGVLNIVAAAAIEPIRIALIASALDGTLRHWGGRGMASVAGIRLGSGVADGLPREQQVEGS